MANIFIHKNQQYSTALVNRAASNINLIQLVESNCWSWTSPINCGCRLDRYRNTSPGERTEGFTILIGAFQPNSPLYSIVVSFSVLFWHFIVRGGPGGRAFNMLKKFSALYSNFVLLYVNIERIKANKKEEIKRWWDI